ncbi:MAG TPA: thioredoxin [Luteimonas sp.]|nr:thioredoxin [Luteimonas sp.]
MNDKVIHAGDADFDSTVLQSSEPVLVDFWAPWCAPCKMIGPVVDQLADEYEGRAKMVKVDVQAFPNLGIRYNVRSIPMLLLFKNGQVQSSQMGAPGNIKAVLNQMIEKAL